MEKYYLRSFKHSHCLRRFFILLQHKEWMVKSTKVFSFYVDKSPETSCVDKSFKSQDRLTDCTTKTAPGIKWKTLNLNKALHINVPLISPSDVFSLIKQSWPFKVVQVYPWWTIKGNSFYGYIAATTHRVPREIGEDHEFNASARLAARLFRLHVARQWAWPIMVRHQLLGFRLGRALINITNTISDFIYQHFQVEVTMVVSWAHLPLVLAGRRKCLNVLNWITSDLLIKCTGVISGF
jgi:hypothetical protein